MSSVSSQEQAHIFLLAILKLEKSLMQDPFLARHEHAAELYLIRHGDAIPGPDEIIPSGIYNNLPLSQKGRSQAQALARRLKNVSFAAAYSSPLKRCLETGAPLLEQLDMQAILVEELKEVRLGSITPVPEFQQGDDLTPLTEALRARQAEIVRLAASTGTWDSIPNSEASRAFRQRIASALDEIAQRHIGERILVFAHAGVINAYAAEVLGLAKDFFFPCANTSITIVRAADQQRVLYVLNDIAHLQGSLAQS
ncbi:histidine phosphatase family protein [Ktedonosporobacter rubrisoli]|nr:histidine phosphatase family protein [Ktedonosporobacter rubrisoli]